MTQRLDPSAMLDREFLQVRARILEIAGSLDRIDRTDGSAAVRVDPRLAQLDRAIGLLTDGKPDRAERVQQVFSDSYDPNWLAHRKATI